MRLNSTQRMAISEIMKGLSRPFVSGLRSASLNPFSKNLLQPEHDLARGIDLLTLFTHMSLKLLVLPPDRARALLDFAAAQQAVCKSANTYKARTLSYLRC